MNTGFSAQRLHTTMNTSQLVPLPRALSGVLLFPLLLLLTPCISHAVAGMMDAVIITQDLTDAYKWPRERAQWEAVTQLLSRQLEVQQQQLQRAGQAAESGSRVTGKVSSVNDSLAGIMAMEERERTVEEGKALPAAGKRGRSTLRADMKVANSFQAMGKTYQRNQELYQHIGALDALHERQREANRSLDSIAKSELEQQKQLLAQLKTATTQADVLAVQAALAASSQRMDVARMKSDQARDDCILAEAMVRAETGRRQVADKEQAEQVAECLKARALSALEAQKDKSL